VVKYFSDSPEQPAFFKALAEVRQLATREGWCFHHVQAIIVVLPLTNTPKRQRGIGLSF
jgi:hypothetical protein